MKPVRLDDIAHKELDDLGAYIARNSYQQRAEKFIDGIYEVIASIQAIPKSGQMRDDLSPGIRQRVCGRHLIFYEELAEHISILHIVDGTRYLPAIFGKI